MVLFWCCSKYILPTTYAACCLQLESPAQEDQVKSDLHSICMKPQLDTQILILRYIDRYCYRFEVGSATVTGEEWHVYFKNFRIRNLNRTIAH